MSKNQSDPDAETAAARRLAEALDPSAIDALLADAQAAGTPIDGVDGLLNQMSKAVLERALQAEMTHHLGYERDDPAGAGTGNSRNGSSTKTVSTTNGPVTITVPRDRNGEFEPKIVPKRARRVGQIDELVLAKFWAGVCAELRNRGVREVLIVYCDGLTGFPEAIEATRTSTGPQSIVQTCTVHLIRAAMRFVSYQDRKRVAAALRPIYTAPTDEAARLELDRLGDGCRVALVLEPVRAVVIADDRANRVHVWWRSPTTSRPNHPFRVQTGNGDMPAMRPDVGSAVVTFGG